MGNRFASLDEYHVLIQGHGILAAITFLFILPASIMIVRFRDQNPGWGQRLHVYLNILAIFLVTIVFMLGWFAVGPSRSLTNPHHGIGLTIYVLMLVQLIGGAWVRRRLRRTQPLRVPVKLMLHQWLGRAIALLGIAQVPLGLTLYGSPKFTFVLYTLWMTFLLILYFILSYRAAPDRDSMRFSTVHEESVIEQRKSGGIGRYILPAAAAAGLAGLLRRGRSKRESRESRQEVIPSRRGSRPGSYIEEEEKYSEDGRGRGGIVNKLLAGAAVVGAGAFAKSWWDRRQRRKADEEAYSAVATDTPSRRRRRNDDHSVISEESVDVRRDRRHGPILPGPGDPLAAATAISAAQSRPVTPRPGPPPVMPPVGRPVGHRRHDSSSSYDSRESPRRERREDDHTVRNTILGGIGLAWLAKKYRDRKERQEQQRVDALRAQEIEDERRLEVERRSGAVPPRFTGDGTPRRSHGRVTEVTDSDISSDLTASTVEPRRSGPMPPLAAGALPAAAAAGAAGEAIAQSRSRHDITQPVPPPPREPREWQESGSEVYNSAGGREHRRHHSSRGREAEAAVAGAALGVAAAEEERRRRERSRSQQSVASPPVSVKVKVMPDRGVTLRRLTEEEAAADRAARRDQSRRRGDSASTLSAVDTAASNRRYRRDESARRDAAEAAAEKQVEAGSSRRRLSPPRPAFAAGRTPKDSSYFSGAPPPPPESHGSPESHGTWSGMSPSGTGTAAGEDPAERRRRRRLERSQRQATGTVEYD
jgi:Eukaryotic cytochrome b561